MEWRKRALMPWGSTLAGDLRAPVCPDDEIWSCSEARESEVKAWQKKK